MSIAIEKMGLRLNSIFPVITMPLAIRPKPGGSCSYGFTYSGQPARLSCKSNLNPSSQHPTRLRFLIASRTHHVRSRAEMPCYQDRNAECFASLHLSMLLVEYLC